MTASLGDLPTARDRNLLGTFCASTAGFSIDANANDVETDNAIDYFIDGIGYTLAAQGAIDISGLTGIPTTPLATGYTGVYVFYVDSAGTISIEAGNHILTTDITAGTATAHWPTPSSSTICPFGALKIVNTSGSDYVLGTTTLSTAGITETFYNLCRVPASF